MTQHDAGWIDRRLASLNRRPFGRVESAFYEFVGAPASRRIIAPVVREELRAATPQTVLDVGCGGGALTEDLAAPGRTVVGVEPSGSQLRRLAERRQRSFQAAAATAAHLPFASGSFDAVISSCTIKHWPDMAEGLAECARVLRRGGQLVIVEIDGGVDPGDLQRFAARTRLPPGLRRLYPSLARRTFVPHSPTSATLTGAMAVAGFDQIRDRRIDSLPFLVASAIRPELEPPTPGSSAHGHHRCVAAVLRSNDSVLLCHRSATREWYPDVWDLPGGHIEVGESGHDALRRELAEELGVAVDVGDQPLTWITDEATEIEMGVWLVSDWDGEVRNLAPSEHDELRWCTVEETKALELAHPSYLELIADVLSS